MNEKQKQRIFRHYDVIELRKNVRKLWLDIEKFSVILRKAEKLNDEKNIKVFSEAINNTEKEIVELEGYIKLIEENGNVDTV